MQQENNEEATTLRSTGIDFGNGGMDCEDGRFHKDGKIDLFRDKTKYFLKDWKSFIDLLLKME